ncbi:MAG: S26 family signal peptidase [Pirellulaceae bacterium]|nr:S26 family signal peptidase [Pirellulaceae bacterium]
MAKTKDEKKPADGGWRETVESIAMAVVLALLFRGFVAEAFVIPTGSMAPTLQGRHKDVKCPQCTFWYQTSASDERTPDNRLTGRHVTTTTCPICRYTQTLDLFNKPNDGSFSGDRIIVGKFAYDLAEPRRWDVIVFKYPGGATQNYIKRLIGLPNERVRIVGGNIHVAPRELPDTALRIARKDPSKLDALLQLVDDTDYIPELLTKVGWPSRWQEFGLTSGVQPAWKVENGGRAFVCDGTQNRDAWLRYRHLVPSHEDWALIELSNQLPSDVPQRKGQLITDFYAYNSEHWIEQIPPEGYDYRKGPFATDPLKPGTYDPDQYDPTVPGPGAPPAPEAFGMHWVDDLAVECLADVTSSGGELLLELIRAGTHHQCRIDLATGTATLGMIDNAGQPVEFVEGERKTFGPKAQTTVKGPGNYRLRLSNCDHEMLLWVNGSVVKFDGPTRYESTEVVSPDWVPEEPGDLAPAGIGSHGAAVKLSSLRVYRDKYYIATMHSNNDYEIAVTPLQLRAIFANPDLWYPGDSASGPTGERGIFDDGSRRHIEFVLLDNQFLPLGDNSPFSSDGRFWQGHHYVERDLLIGKALVIYWPHTWNRPIPYQPNFSKMGRIR